MNHHPATHGRHIEQPTGAQRQGARPSTRATRLASFIAMTNASPRSPVGPCSDVIAKEANPLPVPSLSDMRLNDLFEATRVLVVPFILEHYRPWVEGGRRRNELPRLRVERYDDQERAAPNEPAGAVLDLLLGNDLEDITRENVRLLFDDVNDGGQHDPPFAYHDREELRKLTLRALQDWIDDTLLLLFYAADPQRAFEVAYADFEHRLLSPTYTRLSFSPLDKLSIDEEVTLEEGLVLRYLATQERDTLSEHWAHLRKTPIPPVGLVQLAEIGKGGRIDFAGRVPPLEARDKVLFCIRALAPGGVYSDCLFSARRTCWALDASESSYYQYAATPDPPLNTVLDRHGLPNLVPLWNAIRDRRDLNLRFLATKLQDAAQRRSVLDRFADVAIALQNIFGSEGHRFTSTMAWALRGHREPETRREMYDLAREINRRRNVVLHGNSELLGGFIGNLEEFAAFTDRAEQCLRQALQLFLLNPNFRDSLDDALLGLPVAYRRLPFMF